MSDEIDYDGLPVLRVGRDVESLEREEPLVRGPVVTVVLQRERKLGVVQSVARVPGRAAGGHARAVTMTAEERSASARKAAHSRWSKARKER
jgi:hypothetical protein